MDLSLEESSIPGLMVLRLPVHADDRGWFKENWQREKMIELGLPDFGPVQNNIAFNTRRGVTRGFHAEPWDKLVSVGSGRVHGAWVDLRRGPSFGATFETEIDPSTGIFVPRGVANAYQTLEPATTYVYLVNEHWRSGASYPAVHLGDPTVAARWPVPLSEAEISAKDHLNPTLDQVAPVEPRRPLVLGAAGQLGRALLEAFPEAEGVTRDTLDLCDPVALAEWPWHEYDVILNAAAYTAVDAAETPEGRRAAWRTNAAAVQQLAGVARQNRLLLVHYSTDYVFDGAQPHYDEIAPHCPLGVYGQSKAAGDLAVAGVPRHYLIRTSWVVGEGRNFITTMADLADRGASPSVVDDQVGRLSDAVEIARATRHLIDTGAPFGTYNVTNGGPAMSWFDVAEVVFRLRGRQPGDVTPVSTEVYAKGKNLAPRPKHSVLDLTRLTATGFEPTPAMVAIERYAGAVRNPPSA